MAKLLHFLSLSLLIFIFASPLCGRSASTLPKASLSFVSEKRVFKIGEPIQLVLTLTAKPGTKVIMDQISPTEDELIISPKDDLYYWIQQISLIRGYDDHVTGIMDMPDQPINLNFYLNDHYRFNKPGRYTLKLNTQRIYLNAVRLPTNQIEFEIKEISESEEAEKVEKLSALIDSNLRDAVYRTSLIRELNFLTGTASTIEKVNRYLKHGYEFSNGLYIARDKALVIKMLEDAFNDVNRRSGIDLIQMLCMIRRLQEYEGDNRPENKLIRFARYHEDKRLNDLRWEYIDKLYETLPRRSGYNLLFAVYTVFTNLPKDDVSSPAFIETQRYIQQNFDKFDFSARSNFLNTYWDKLKTPDLIPSIERIIPENTTSSPSSYTNPLLGRLIELDEKRARPFVIQEIKKISEDRYSLQLDILANLKDKYLPEIDSFLLKEIESLAGVNDSKHQWKKSQINLLASRYASPGIYEQLQRIYQIHSSQWPSDVKSGLLAYFAKVDDKAAESLIEAELLKADIAWDSSFFNNLTKFYFSKTVYRFLRKRLEGDDLKIAGTAAYYISKRGQENDKKVLLARYYRWFNERFKINQDPKRRRISSSFQINLISSLTGSKSWKLSEKEFNDLRATCSDEFCLRYFRPQ